MKLSDLLALSVRCRPAPGRACPRKSPGGRLPLAERNTNSCAAPGGKEYWDYIRSMLPRVVLHLAQHEVKVVDADSAGAILGQYS